MRASTDLWEPWAGDRPGPPGKERRVGLVRSAVAAGSPLCYDRGAGRRDCPLSMLMAKRLGGSNGRCDLREDRRDPNSVPVSPIRDLAVVTFTFLPYGEQSWVDPLCRRLNLDLTIRPRGGPEKSQSEK